MHARIITLVAAFVVAAPVTANAQDADKLFKEARRLVEAGDYAHACPMFADSERLEPAPGTLLNLADCEKNVGQLISAQEHYRLAASGFPKNDPRRAFCAKKADDLEPRIAHMTLRLAPGSPKDTVVKRNDAVVADLGKSERVDPGAMAIIVSAPGHVDRPYPLALKDGDTIDLTLQVGAVQPERVEVVVTAPPTHEASASPLRPIGIAVASIGLVSLATGVITGVMAIDRASTVTAHCNTTTNVCIDQTGYDAAQDGRVLSPLSTATIIAGGVLVAAGAVFFVLGGKRSHVTALVGPNVIGASLSGTF